MITLRDRIEMVKQQAELQLAECNKLLKELDAQERHESSLSEREQEIRQNIRRTLFKTRRK